MSSPAPPDENPFQSPVAVKPDTVDDARLRHRRVIVLVLSLLLIPPAVIIAFFAACFTAGMATQSIGVGMLAGIAVGIAAGIFLCRVANRHWNRED